MAQPIVEVAFLNIVATPHPEGVYERLIRFAAHHPVSYWGSNRAAITRPAKARDDSGFLTFTLFLWTEVNPDEPAINKAELEKASFPDEGREFTARYGVNGRSFTCVFDPTIHLLSVEIKNEDGKTVSPERLRKIWVELLSPEVLGKDAELVEVTVVPTEGALSYVLGLEQLNRIEILVKRPNADDFTSDTNRIMRNLIQQNAKSEKRVLTRQPKTDGLVLDEESLAYASVAAHNGYVNADGLDTNGERAKRSTKEVPRIKRYAVAAGDLFSAAVRAIAREARDAHSKL